MASERHSLPYHEFYDLKMELAVSVVVFTTIESHFSRPLICLMPSRPSQIHHASRELISVFARVGNCPILVQTMDVTIKPGLDTAVALPKRDEVRGPDSPLFCTHERQGVQNYIPQHPAVKLQ